MTIDMVTHLLNRIKNLEPFIVTVEKPDNFKFKGVIPFDLSIRNNIIYATVFALDFDEAVAQFHEFVEYCTNDQT